MASLESIFKRLNERNHTLTSPRTPEYNCIAFAAGETHRWWWPIGAYWPDNLPRLESVDGFVLAFETLGYVVCESGNLESGFEKIAIYEKSGKPTHMARQLSSGKWVSKCGNLEDIEHETLELLDEYGSVVRFLRRPS
ncbi:MAG TPA: hypothetical protein VKQ72_02465 [Aggregatilineales bacterium]|nr:hypothetical protein [Aggregatilineales bacterium]